MSNFKPDQKFLDYFVKTMFANDSELDTPAMNGNAITYREIIKEMKSGDTGWEPTYNSWFEGFGSDYLDSGKG